LESYPNFPDELLSFRNHLKELTANDTPNYGHLKKLLRSALFGLGETENLSFPWKDLPLSSTLSFNNGQPILYPDDGTLGSASVPQSNDVDIDVVPQPRLETDDRLLNSSELAPSVQDTQVDHETIEFGPNPLPEVPQDIEITSPESIKQESLANEVAEEDKKCCILF